jgi:hypothetical protein
MNKMVAKLTFLVLFCVPTAFAIDASDFDELLGYTITACTHAGGELEGADFDKPVKLDNGNDLPV